MSDDGRRRKRLFDLYSKQLSLYHPEQVGRFLCPTCFTVFTEDDLNGPNPRLSLAHIIPESMGGTACTLTCTECNSGSGDSLETDLLERYRQEMQAKGHLWIPDGRMVGKFGNIGAEFRFSPDRSSLSIIMVQKQSNPADFARVKEALDDAQAGRSEFAFTLTHRPQAVNGKRAGLTIYQAAYLLMFRHFGYDYILRPSVAPLIERLANPDALGDLDTKFPTLGRWSESLWSDHRSCAVLIRRKPRALMAALRFHVGEGPVLTLGVTVPGFEEPFEKKADGGKECNGWVVARLERWLTHKGAGLRVWRSALRDDLGDDQPTGTKPPVAPPRPSG